MTNKFEVETRFHGDTWENCWTNDKGEPVYYESHAAACGAIRDHISDCEQAVKEGDMIDAPSRSDFRVVERIPYATPEERQAEAEAEANRAIEYFHKSRAFLANADAIREDGELVARTIPEALEKMQMVEKKNLDTLQKYKDVLTKIAKIPLYNERLLPSELEAAGDEVTHDSDGVVYNPSSDTESTQLREAVELARVTLFNDSNRRG